MRKLLITTLVLLLATTFSTSWANEIEINQKKRVLVDYFGRVKEMTNEIADKVRADVISGFASRGRHEVIDIRRANLPEIRTDVVRSPNSIVNSNKNAEEAHEKFMEEVDPDLILTGDIIKFESIANTKTNPITYKTSIAVRLTMIDMRTEETFDLGTFTSEASAKKASEANVAAATGFRSQLYLYVENKYKFYTQIKRFDEALDKKGKPTALYIESGKSMGVRTGDLFLVYVNDDTQGENGQRKIGKLRVKSVTGDDESKCALSKGGEEIKEAFDNNIPMTIISDGESVFGSMFRTDVH